MKQTCENCGDQKEEMDMIATPQCKWICPPCFAEDPEAHGFDFDLDGDEFDEN